ncbi:MAG: hypothetical protein LBK63_03280 [Treponema sp.]|jgi:hypothetical protein|nr:hypothetical protein [Treponema sp.]
MADLFFDYTVLDQGYTHGKVQSISGSAGAPSGLKDPEDTRIDDIAPYTDNDPEVFSYMAGTTPRVLLCNVTTNFGTSPATSTGKYSAYTPVVPQPPSTRTWNWNLVGTKDIQLVDSSGNPVAGNPYGVAQIGNFLYIIEYDTAKISMVKITGFEAAAGPTYQVDGLTDASGAFVTQLTANDYPHGAAILILTDNDTGFTYLYALFAVAQNSGGYPASYSASALVRYTVNTDDEDPNAGALSDPFATQVGLNAKALVPAPNPAPDPEQGQDAKVILVPAIGGTEPYGTTNGTASNLSVVQAFANFPILPTGSPDAAPVAFTGDPAPSGTLSSTDNYDIRGAAVSDDADGTYAYLLTATYSAAGTTAFWRLYQTTAATILGITSSETLSTAVTNSHLTAKDATADATNGDPGYYWEVQYENNATVANGRLWFVKGSPIRISLGSTYGTFKLIDAGSGGPLYSPAFNVNSADLIGETIYAASQNVSKDTRLIKGNAARQATQAAAAASEEEEEEK